MYDVDQRKQTWPKKFEKITIFCETFVCVRGTLGELQNLFKHILFAKNVKNCFSEISFKQTPNLKGRQELKESDQETIQKYVFS